MRPVKKETKIARVSNKIDKPRGKKHATEF